MTLSGLVQIVLLLAAIAGGWWTLVSRVDGNDKDIANLQRIVTDIPGIKSDVLLLQNTLSNRSQARDAQLSSITGDVTALSGRVDRLENSLNGNLKDIAKSMAQMQSDIAAINATLSATAKR